MKTSKNIWMLMFAVVAMGVSGTFAIADDSVNTQSISNTADSQSIFGHVEATVYDEGGNIKAYTQSDNKIVNNGLDMIMFNTFSPSTTMSGGISTTLGQVTHMQLGLGTTEVAAGINIITATAGTCSPDTFTAVSAGGGAAVTLSSTFTSTGDGDGCLEVIGEAGLFDGSTGTGTDDMFAQNAFASTVELAATDSLVIDWDFTFTDN